MGSILGADSHRMWGLLSRLWRIKSGLTHDEFAKHVGYSKSLVVGIENGIRRPSDIYITRADECTGADGWLIKTAEFLSTEPVPSYREECDEAERQALAMMVYDTHVLHSLLRTEPYVRAALEISYATLAADDFETRIETELQRLQLLTRQPTCVMSFVIESSVLSRPVGGHEIMRKQLDHLAVLSEQQNITIQVMPNSAGAHPGLGGPMTVLQLPDYTWAAILEVQELNHLVNDRQGVSLLQYRFNSLCSHALTPKDSTSLIRKMATEL